MVLQMLMLFKKTKSNMDGQMQRILQQIDEMMVAR